MEPYSLPYLQSRLAELQEKLEQTPSNSKRFKLGVKIDKCRAMIEQRMPPKATAASMTTTAATKTSTPSSPAAPFSSIAPLRLTALELAARAERAARFESKETKQRRPGEGLTLRDARQRAVSGKPSSSATAASPTAAAAAAFGKNEALEKPYLRLTSLPTVADVRPPKVLAEALDFLKKKWTEEEGTASSSSSVRYNSYFREQLKSIRQDLVVQSVRGPLAVNVYEAHARIALESGDIAEFNQCQTALEELYREAEQAEGEAAVRAAGTSRSSSSSSSSPSSSFCLRNRAEFSCYRILYAQAMDFSSSLSPRPSSSSSSSINLAMQSVREADRGHPFVRSALEAAALARAGDAKALAAALEGSPRMSPYLLDLLLPHARGVAARALVAAWRGGGGGTGAVSSLSDAARLLGFFSSSSSFDGEGDDEGEERERAASAAAELLRAAGAVIDVASGTVSVPRSSASSSAAVVVAPPSNESKDKKRKRGDDSGDKKKKKKEKKDKKKKKR